MRISMRHLGGLAGIGRWSWHAEADREQKERERQEWIEQYERERQEAEKKALLELISTSPMQPPPKSPPTPPVTVSTKKPMKTATKAGIVIGMGVVAITLMRFIS